MKRVKISESQLKRLVELNITNNAPNIGMGGKSSGKKNNNWNQFNDEMYLQEKETSNRNTGETDKVSKTMWRCVAGKCTQDHGTVGGEFHTKEECEKFCGRKDSTNSISSEEEFETNYPEEYAEAKETYRGRPGDQGWAKWWTMFLPKGLIWNPYGDGGLGGMAESTTTTGAFPVHPSKLKEKVTRIKKEKGEHQVIKSNERVGGKDIVVIWPSKKDQAEYGNDLESIEGINDVEVGMSCHFCCCPPRIQIQPCDFMDTKRGERMNEDIERRKREYFLKEMKMKKKPSRGPSALGGDGGKEKHPMKGPKNWGCLHPDASPDTVCPSCTRDCSGNYPPLGPEVGTNMFDMYGDTSCCDWMLYDPFDD